MPEFDYLSFRMREGFFDSYRLRSPAWGFPAGAGNTLGEHSWLTKYSRRKVDGTRERFWEGLRRVIEGMYSIQKDHALAQRLPWNEEQALRSAEEAYERCFAGKWSPPGRGLWMLGTERVNGRRDGSPLYNCFAGGTQVITPEGIRSLGELAGTDGEVWALGSWHAASFRSFGRQRVQRVTFGPYGLRSNVRHTEVVTPDHRWPLRNGSVTTNLRVGDAVPADIPLPSPVQDDEGFRHGLIFGDGSVSYQYKNGDFSHIVRLCGEKSKHQFLFARVTYPPSANGEPTAWHRSHVNMKALPHAGDSGYLNGFIHGWAVADGDRKEDGLHHCASFSIQTQNQEAADWLLDNAAVAGFIVIGHNTMANETNYGPRSGMLHKIRLTSVSEDSAWTVKAIEPLEEEEEVFCAVVPSCGMFTLATGVRTGNCSFLSTAGLADSPTLPFTRMMDESMLGIGVGFDVLGAGKVTLHEPQGRYPHAVGDSREGWCESLGCLLRAFFTGSRMPHFDYSRVRPAGAPIKGFGGIASGPAPLEKLHRQVTALLSGRAGQVLTSSDITDIMNMAGKCVVSANVRRSAQIALGPAGDDDFLDLKNWDVNPERMGRDGWGHLSNNSVYAAVGDDLSHLAGRISLNGEPGVAWLDVMQKRGRLADPEDGRDYRVRGQNPCGEIPLESFEKCNLVETFPTNCDSFPDYLRTLKFAFLYAKTVTLLPVQWPESNEVMIRNRRIGTSMTGIAQFAEEHGWAELRRWQDAGYAEIRRWDRVYSEWLGIRESVKVTTVKPSGTVSLLFGVTPGAHWPKERGFYVRTVRDTKDSPVAQAMADAGYPVEPSVSDPETTVVISIPVEGPDVRPERDVSVWEKASLAATCQRWWSDNSVSVTLTFREDEAGEIPAVLRAFDGQLKSVSFLPMAEGVYAQAPYQRVSREEWEALRAGIRPLDWDALYRDGTLPEAEGELFCTTDACELPR